MSISEAQRIEMLEAIAQDATLKATQRLRALEELGKIRRAQEERAGKPSEKQAEDAPYPMADLWEIEDARRERARSRKSRQAARA